MRKPGTFLWTMALSKTLGMEEPERSLIEKSDFQGIPEEFTTLSTGTGEAPTEFTSKTSLRSLDGPHQKR